MAFAELRSRETFPGDRHHPRRRGQLHPAEHHQLDLVAHGGLDRASAVPALCPLRDRGASALPVADHAACRPVRGDLFHLAACDLPLRHFLHAHCPSLFDGPFLRLPFAALPGSLGSRGPPAIPVDVCCLRDDGDLLSSLCRAARLGRPRCAASACMEGEAVSADAVDHRAAFGGCRPHHAPCAARSSRAGALEQPLVAPRARSAIVHLHGPVEFLFPAGGQSVHPRARALHRSGVLRAQPVDAEGFPDRSRLPVLMGGVLPADRGQHAGQHACGHPDRAL